MGFSREVTPRTPPRPFRTLSFLTSECELLSGLGAGGGGLGAGGGAEALGLVFPTQTEGWDRCTPREASRLPVLMSHPCLKKCKTGF